MVHEVDPPPDLPRPQFARPDWMIITVFPVPPLAVRPSVMMDSSSRSEDDLTYQLVEIMRCNTRMRTAEQQGGVAHVMADLVQLLQFHISTLMDNTIAGQPQAMQKSGRPVKSIVQRMKVGLSCSPGPLAKPERPPGGAQPPLRRSSPRARRAACGGI